MNYFSYFSEIEDTFIRRRGKHLLLSPIDWALIENWKERGVPLHVALRGIEHAFDSYDAKKQKRTVKTLVYCQEEVEAQHAEWLESRVGNHEDATAPTADADEKISFPRATVISHLDRSMNELNSLRNSTSNDDLHHVFERALNLLADVKDEYSKAARPDARKLEESLTGIDRMLDDAIRNAVIDTDWQTLTAETEAQLKQYKRHMEKAVYEQTRNTLLRKRLREHFGVPRLSLFFL